MNPEIYVIVRKIEDSEYFFFIESDGKTFKRSQYVSSTFLKKCSNQKLLKTVSWVPIKKKNFREALISYNFLKFNKIDKEAIINSFAEYFI